MAMQSNGEKRNQPEETTVSEKREGICFPDVNMFCKRWLKELVELTEESVAHILGSWYCSYCIIEAGQGDVREKIADDIKLIGFGIVPLYINRKEQNAFTLSGFLVPAKTVEHKGVSFDWFYDAILRLCCKYKLEFILAELTEKETSAYQFAVSTPYNLRYQDQAVRLNTLAREFFGLSEDYMSIWALPDAQSSSEWSYRNGRGEICRISKH